MAMQNLTGVPSMAVSDLGLGAGMGDMLLRQTRDETEEERRKRLMGMSTTQSPAVMALFGPGAGVSGGRGY